MFNLIFLRIFQSVPVLFVVIALTFIMVHAAPGGPFDDERRMSPDVLKNMEAAYNLGAPLHEQFYVYLKNLAQGDFGPSYKFPSRSVTEMILASFPVTLELSFYALIVAIGFGIPLGVISSLKPNTWQDYIPMSVAMLGICLPSMVMGPILILIFGIHFQWLPASGWGYTPVDKILPALTLGATYAAYIARIIRSSMLETLSQDYVSTARAKGLSPLRVIWRHAFPNALTPVISFLGPAVAGLLAGSFVVETIFQIPGLGRLYVESAFNRDYTMILGTTIFFSAIIILFNLLSDIALIWLNPKLRTEMKS